MNPHTYACQKTIDTGKKCDEWCGNQHACLSTLTYAQPWKQEAYERGHKDALNAVEAELGRMAQSTSPHRRTAAEDLFYALQKIKPTAATGSTE